MRVQRFFEFVQAGTVKKFKDSYGVSRADLPQVHAADLPDFLDFLRDQGVSITEETVDVEKLKPAQTEFLEDKVEQKLLAFREGREPVKVFIVSSDGYIIDSHHQYEALLRMSPKKKVDIMRADVKIDRLLKLVSSYPKASFKKITENLG